MRAIEDTVADGRTPMTAALRKALEVLEELPEASESRRRRKIILISDGYPCPANHEEIDEIIEELARNDIYLATIGVGDLFDRHLLTRMAARTRAPFLEVHQVRQLPYLLEKLA